jgi:LmbE family N-acetylglucosaminyl deacetylase
VLQLALPARDHLSVLAIGCHADDVEIGCGGSLLGLARRYPHLRITWVVLSAKDQRGEEAAASADAFLAGLAEPTVIVKGFRDGFLPYHGAEVKDFFEELQGVVSPDVVFTHQGRDAHQDHRLASELTWNTWRDHLILEYEIPKYDGDLGQPNVFMPLSEDVCARKIQLLLEHFGSQRRKRWFTEDLFRGLMRLRGMECNSPSGYAEAFYGRKLALGG